MSWLVKTSRRRQKRTATAAGRNLMQSFLKTPPPPGKRMKHMKRTAPLAVSLPSNDDSEQTCFSNVAFVHKHSYEGVKSELALFDVPPRQTRIEDTNLCRLSTRESSIIRDTGNRRCQYLSCKHLLVQLRWFEETAPTSPPIHRWHL